VPGHFHFYLLLGVLAMVLALMYHVIGKPRDGRPDAVYDRAIFPVYVGGALIFLFAFLDAGRDSVPRRMATHLQAWLFTDKVGSIGAILVVLAMLYFAIRITAGLLKMPQDASVNTTDAAG
jgi:cytochrome c oxidase subunit 1